MTERKTNSVEMLPECLSAQCQEVIRNRTDAKASSPLSHNLGNGTFLNFNNSYIRNLKAAVWFCPVQSWILPEWWWLLLLSIKLDLNNLVIVLEMVSFQSIKPWLMSGWADTPLCPQLHSRFITQLAGNITKRTKTRVINNFCVQLT